MSHASLDTASKHVGYINKATAARLLKQAFLCMATCRPIIICWSPSLVMRLGVKSICRHRWRGRGGPGLPTFYSGGGLIYSFVSTMLSPRECI